MRLDGPPVYTPGINPRLVGAVVSMQGQAEIIHNTARDNLHKTRSYKPDFTILKAIKLYCTALVL